MGTFLRNAKHWPCAKKSILRLVEKSWVPAILYPKSNNSLLELKVDKNGRPHGIVSITDKKV